MIQRDNIVARKGWLAIHIAQLICPEEIEDKLAAKHGVTVGEARQVLLSQPRFRFAEKGHISGDDVYAPFGQTYSGRYLVVFFVYTPKTQTVIIISARDLEPAERRRYGRKSSE
jgi:uncharacterized DUF497 family protein